MRRRNLLLGLAFLVAGLSALLLLAVERRSQGYRETEALLVNTISFGINKSALLMHTADEELGRADTVALQLTLHDTYAELHQASSAILSYSVQAKELNTVLAAILDHYKGNLRTISEQLLRAPVVTGEQRARLHELEQDLAALSEQLPEELWREHRYAEINQRLHALCPTLHLHHAPAVILASC